MDDARRPPDRVIGSLKDPTHGLTTATMSTSSSPRDGQGGCSTGWCEHALTVAIESSLTEIVPDHRTALNARCTGKTSARFTNLIAEPERVGETVNEAGQRQLEADLPPSLLIEQRSLRQEVHSTPNVGQAARTGSTNGEDGYQNGKTNVAFTEATDS